VVEVEHSDTDERPDLEGQVPETYLRGILEIVGGSLHPPAKDISRVPGKQQDIWRAPPVV
jgi:hypothetical protein